MLRVSRFLSIILVSLLLVGCGPTNTVPTYNVSGRVTLSEGGSGLSGVKIACGNQGTTETYSDGSWTMYGLKGTVAIVPSKAGYDFKPSSRTVSGADSYVNFVASPTGTYSASGYVRDGLGTPLPDVRVAFDRSFTSVTTTHDGKWIKHGLSGTVVATPKKDGWTFSPSYRSLTGSTTEADFTSRYTISGRVADQSGNGIQSVTIGFSEGHESSLTDEDGYWIQEGLSGPITVTPKRMGYTFNPSDLIVDKPSSNVNFTAIPETTGYSVSGRVTDQRGVGIADVLLFLGGGFGTARTGSNGFWSASELSGGVTVTPAKTGLTFTPETVTVSSSSTTVNFVGNPVANTYTVSGRVVDSRDGDGLYKVSFTFSGGFGRTQSDVSGDWSKSGLYGTVTVTPSRPGWTFLPESRVVTETDSFVDFSGTPTGSSASDGGER